MTTEPPDFTALDTARDVVRGRVSVSMLYGPYGSRGTHLEPSPGGYEMLSVACGFLVGLAQHVGYDGQHWRAARWATNLFEQLDYLASYGGQAEGTKTPAFLVELCADSTMLSFGLRWYRLAGAEPSFGASAKERHGVRYVASMVGGLIFHGSNESNYTVRLTADQDAPWSVHT